MLEARARRACHTAAVLARTCLASLVLLVSSCGPEAEVVPRSGVYDLMTEVLPGDCEMSFDDSSTLTAVVFADEFLQIGFPDFLFKSPAGWLSSWVYARLERDPEGEGFVPPPGETFFDTWFELRGCRHRRGITAEMLADDVIRARVTYEWKDIGGCAWLVAPQTACTMVHEKTYTLREACDECSLDEISDRVRALYAEQLPPPK